MGLGDDGLKQESWNVKKSNGGKKKEEEDDDDEEVESRCWVKFRFISSCMPSRSKVDTSVSGLSTFGNVSILPN